MHQPAAFAAFGSRVGPLFPGKTEAAGKGKEKGEKGEGKKGKGKGLRVTKTLFCLNKTEKHALKRV